MRNRGGMTLIAPDYVKEWSSILSYIVQKTNESSLYANSKKIIEDDKIKIATCNELMKGEFITQMKEKLCQQCSVGESSIVKLLQKIINRLMNALIGNEVKSYKNECMHKNSDVQLPFRKEIAAMCQNVKKEIKKENKQNDS